VALDLEVTPELREEGLAREVVRLVQDARKSAGLVMTDRIELGIEAPDEVTRAIQAHLEYVGKETLVVSFSARPLFALEHDTTEKLDGMRIRITLRRAPGSSEGASEGAPPVV